MVHWDLSLGGKAKVGRRGKRMETTDDDSVESEDPHESGVKRQ